METNLLKIDLYSKLLHGTPNLELGSNSAIILKLQHLAKVWFLLKKTYYRDSYKFYFILTAELKTTCLLSHPWLPFIHSSCSVDQKFFSNQSSIHYQLNNRFN